MNRSIIAAAFVLVAGALGTAHAGPRADALDDITDAMDIVGDASSGCYRAAMTELTAIQQLLRDESEGRALAKIRSLKRGLDRCPRAVGRLLRSAEDALEADRRDRRDRRDDRHDRDDRRDWRRDDRREEPKPEPPKRASNVPYSDFHAACLETWLIHEIARDNADQATMGALGANSSMACNSTTGLGRANYSNGTMMHTDAGAWYYPNGTMAKSGAGAYYYPNGTMAKSGAGAWYYPNGTMAKSGSGTWYYPNGTQAGGWQVLEGWACTTAGDQHCKRYKSLLASDVEDWRTFAVVQLAARAGR
ncbi:MAG: hypothetical protein M4D80_09410 [Myxococcota bacterium]|nr:hypothetical protein [Myxococcota bacterium]